MSGFDRLQPALQHHIVNSLGWRSLRPVQDESIEAVLDGANLVVLAPTAGGKTEAAFFPLISRMLEASWDGPSVIYVSPIKALLNNQEHRLRRYLELVGHTIGVWHGDVTATEKKRILEEPPDVLLTTPESLEVLLISRKVAHESFFRNLRAVVVDEVHAFAGDDRGWHLLALLARISRIAVRDIQRVGLSATVGNPEELAEWLSAGSDRSHRVVGRETATVAAAAPVSTVPRVELDFVGHLTNAAKVIHALHRTEKRLVFVDSRARVERLAAELRQMGTRTFVSHSSLGVDERRQAEAAFARGQDCVIVATSALELGIDVGDLDRVVQIDAPGTVSSFLQRMGRTGRREGTERNCLFLATSDEAFLRAATIVELWRSGYVEPATPPPDPLHILAQQLLALALQEGGIGRNEWFGWIQSVPPFAALDPAARSALVDWMLAEEILFDEEGILWMGKEGEATYGRRNYLDLLAAFTAPPLFKVLRGNKDLGSVHESSFMARHDEAPPILLLGGRSWRVKQLDWKRRLAHVELTDEKGRSMWKGAGQLLSFEICQAIRGVLTSAEEDEGWTGRARKKMQELRGEYAWLGSDTSSAATAVTTIRAGASGELEWWTFGGGRANAALAHQLGSILGVRAAGDNFTVRIREPVAAQDLEEAIRSLRGLPVDQIRPEVDDEAIQGLKFSECLPKEMAEAVVGRRMGDAEGVRRVVEGSADLGRAQP